MISSLKKKIYQSRFLTELVHVLEKHSAARISGLTGSFSAFVTQFLAEQIRTWLLFVAPDHRFAERIWSDLLILTDEIKIAYFPSRFEADKPSYYSKEEIVGLQLSALERILDEPGGIIVTSVPALMEKFPSLPKLQRDRLTLKPGIEIPMEYFTEKLVEFGYERTDIVSGAGEFAVRGGIVDVFPFERWKPIRIEWFGEQIDTIRTFDVLSQRSSSLLSSVSILPSVQKREKDNVTLLDILPSSALLFLQEPETYERSLERISPVSVEQYWDSIYDAEFLETQTQSKLKALQQRFENFWRVENSLLGDTSKSHIHFHTSPIEEYRGNIRLLRQHIHDFHRKHQPSANVYLLMEESYELERLEGLLEDDDSIQIGLGALHGGFVFPDAKLMVITEKDLYGRSPRKRNLGKYRGGIPLSRIHAITPGELMVHVDHGIGRYLGLTKIQVAGAEQECLMLQYQGGDLLYVNIEHLRRVKRYRGGEGVVPQLSKLGGKDWQRLKEKTQKAIQKMAKDLLELYAQRKAQKGFQFSPDHPWLKELEASFIYDETPDQLRTIEEVKRDMESSSVMDRLVCGDVGFGKTEVALRAAFKAVLDGKQVAVLVPTTVLAQQHFDTFRSRLKNYPVVVELLTRFRSPKQQREILERVKNGAVDVIIGTHRLLSNDVVFKDLGLLIVDEEHRFGVRQKEKIKTQFRLIDVLSLTATPIPRTLHMALMGSRDMSTINTPPSNRLPVISEVHPFDQKLIRRAIVEEVSRGGQVFVVHNRVRSIESMANLIRRLVPEARVAVAHGQMKGHELERVMLSFIAGEYDCLVSTMIIESGIDMPNVNTLIVNRADKLGLAQLYQLKGRVGRSNRQAYAYFLVPPLNLLSDTALKRLQTIEEHLELGAGLQIAMKDLEIRGAGNLLGKEQSGFLNAVGFDLYNKLLRETVSKLKGGESQKTEETSEPPDVHIECGVDAFISEDYVPMDYERFAIYDRLSLANSADDVKELEEELRDRFGPLPKATRNLLELARIRIAAAGLGIHRISIKNNTLTFYFENNYINSIAPEHLQKLVRSIQELSPNKLRFLHGKKFGFKFEFKGSEETTLIFVKNFIKNLTKKAA